MKDDTNEFSFLLKVSSIKGAGIGVFATHNIRKGTKLALNKEGGDSRSIDKENVPKEFKHFLIYLENGKVKAPAEFNHLWIVWYINHSDKPNAKLMLPENNHFCNGDSFRAINVRISSNTNTRIDLSIF